MAEKVPSGHTIQKLEEDEEELLKKKYFLYTDGVMRLQPGNWIMPTNFNKYSDLMHNFEVKSTDIFAVTFPKSGTTWIQEIVWNLVHNPNLDNPEADKTLDAKFPTFEGDMSMATTGAPSPDPEGVAMKMFGQLCPGKHYSDGILLHLAAYGPPPRMFKTHLPFCFLPPKTLDTCKIFYVVRDPRDVMTSLYHYVRLQILWGFRGNLDEFIEDVLNDRVPFAPYWNHLKLAWEKKNHPNVCLIFFEDLKNDTVSEVKRIDKFLGTNRNEEQIQNVVRHTSFGQMKERTKKNPPTSNDNRFFNKDVEKEEGGFFRKGKVGDWKNRFSPQQVEKLNAWMVKNLPQFGENFKYKV